MSGAGRRSLWNIGFRAPGRSIEIAPAYRSAFPINFDRGMPRACAIRTIFSIVTFRLPCSIRPMCDGSILAASASASCEMAKPDGTQADTTPELSVRYLGPSTNQEPVTSSCRRAATYVQHDRLKRDSLLQSRYVDTLFGSRQLSEIYSEASAQIFAKYAIHFLIALSFVDISTARYRFKSLKPNSQADQRFKACATRFEQCNRCDKIASKS